MTQKPLWHWQLVSSLGTVTGTIRGVDPRDALSRMLTSNTSDGKLLGEQHGIPVDVLYHAPGNGDRLFEAAEPEGWSIQLRMVTCPNESRHEGDIAGCGSTDVTDPDDEGMVDCCSCGLFFNPATAY